MYFILLCSFPMPILGSEGFGTPTPVCCAFFVFFLFFCLMHLLHLAVMWDDEDTPRESGLTRSAAVRGTRKCPTNNSRLSSGRRQITCSLSATWYYLLLDRGGTSLEMLRQRPVKRWQALHSIRACPLPPTTQSNILELELSRYDDRNNIVP
jgi:hypothetical protein